MSTVKIPTVKELLKAGVFFHVDTRKTRDIMVHYYIVDEPGTKLRVAVSYASTIRGLVKHLPALMLLKITKRFLKVAGTSISVEEIDYQIGELETLLKARKHKQSENCTYVFSYSTARPIQTHEDCYKKIEEHWNQVTKRGKRHEN